jgi:putative hydrolase of the HAD superfamily
MSVKTLILDFGEVLVRRQPPRVVRRMARLANLTVGEFTERYWSHRPPYDAGLPAPEYWLRVLATPRDDAPQKGDVIRELIEADYESWTDYREEMWRLTADFKAAGGRTAMLSNGVPEIMERVRNERALDRYFDAVVVSYEVGCTKPDPAIYEICLNRLQASASSALFVDDRVINLETAAQLGMQTLHYRGDHDTALLRRRLAANAGAPGL